MASDNNQAITLEKARELREQLSPAFAGYVTDGNISNRDVLATLMDLVSKGYIGMDFESQKEPVIVKRVYLLAKPDTLLPFEKAFIEVLFSRSTELIPRQVKEIIESSVLHNVIDKNTNALATSKILKSQILLLRKDGTAKEFDSPAYLLDDQINRGFSRFPKNEIRTVDDYNAVMGQLRERVFSFAIVVVLVYGAIGFLGYTQGVSGSITNENLPTFFIVLFLVFLPPLFLVPILFMWYKLRKKKVLLLVKFTTLPFVKGRYEELFDFILQYPLKKQRLYNEFMPFAVAFGLDTSWNESFGVLAERIVKSTDYDAYKVAEEKRSLKGRINLVKCIFCDSISPKGNAECWKCAKPLKESAYATPVLCSQCGSLSKESSSECWVCGFKWNTPGSSP